MAEANLLSRTNSFMCRSASFGFGSNVSMWLGPPSISRKMQALAFAGTICGFAARTPARARSLARSAVKATPPRPYPRRYMNWRRSIDIHKLVGVEEDEAEIGRA